MLRTAIGCKGIKSCLDQLSDVREMSYVKTSYQM